MMRKVLIFVVTLNSMWYFVEKNGKAVKAYKNEERAKQYARTQVKFDCNKDVLRVVAQDGRILLEW